MTLPFTMDRLVWRAWGTPVALADCDERQIAVLEESDSSAKENEYYLTLIRDVPALLARSRLFNAIMYARRGLPRAERELAATAESRVNGCVFCASVHSRLFVRYSRDEDSMRRLLDEGVDTELAPRLRAIVDYSVKLSATPPSAGADDVEALRQVGLSDEDILDVSNAVAMFAWANRLMQTLGEPERA